ncbi:MAG: hypothetical protein SF123_22650 [Chloroflexota bacterium]|nr:hypothetical protein [Chloroflexota bacterium]
MSILYSPAVQTAFEQAAAARSFSMRPLSEQIAALAGGSFISSARLLAQALGDRPARHVLHGLLRFSFLIETVLVRGGATKMTVRWSEALANDVRGASFADCDLIFENLLTILLGSLDDEAFRKLLIGFAAHKLVSYEVPLDYRQRLIESPIHRAENVVWDTSVLPARTIAMRALLRNPAFNPYADVFVEVYGKIAVKTYLTDRAQTGDHQTNREKRWEAHPSSFQYALRRDCWSVEEALINQICHFADFPADLTALLTEAGVLHPIPTPYRCPITLEPLSFTEFRDEVLNPRHGRSHFQAGHLNPLRGASGTLGEGHNAANIGWITADGNRIQGHLSLDETRALLRRIADNYRAADLD